MLPPGLAYASPGKGIFAFWWNEKRLQMQPQDGGDGRAKSLDVCYRVAATASDVEPDVSSGWQFDIHTQLATHGFDIAFHGG